MTIPNWVVPGFTLVYTTAFGAAIQQSAVTGTWILDALTVSPGSVTVAFSARKRRSGKLECCRLRFRHVTASGADDAAARVISAAETSC